MKKIIKSLSIITAVAAIVAVGTIAFFSDTETSVGNTFTAGTIDIDIDGENPWTSNYDIGDLKPGEVGYINFRINNVGENPVDVSKKLYNMVEAGGVKTEPECEAEGGTWVNYGDHCTGETPIDNIQTQILYDLSVEVYDGTGKIWWQTIYEVDGVGDVSLYDVYETAGDTYVALGMIPVGGYMLVTQSYHFNADAGNKYQGDSLTFDMEILGEQLTGANGKATVVLENKTYSGGDWVINSGDSIAGTLEYETNGPEFVYTVSGTAPAANTDYVLAIGYDTDTNVDTFVVAVHSDVSTGNFSVSGSEELGKDMMGVKAWLVPANYWNSNAQQVQWTNWPSMVGEFLWETSFVWYNDTDL